MPPMNPEPAALQRARGVEERRSISLVEAHVQMVAVARSVQVRLRGHRGLEAQAVRYAPDRLQHLHAAVRGRERLQLPYRELQVPVPHLGVALLGPDAHLLQRLRQLRDELRSRGEREAARVRRPVQRTVRPPHVELRLIRGDAPVPSLPEPHEHPPQCSARAPVPGSGRVRLRHVAGDHRLAAGEGERGERREVWDEAALPHRAQARGRVQHPARVKRQHPLREPHPCARPPLEGVPVDRLRLGNARMIHEHEPHPQGIHRQRSRCALPCLALGLHLSLQDLAEDLSFAMRHV